MDKLSWYKSLTPAEIAQAFFWVNLLPTTASATLIGYVILDDEITIGIKDFFLLSILFFGCITEVVYFLQFNFTKYTFNTSLWMLSMVYHMALIFIIALTAIVSHIWGMLWFTIYPNLFYYLSKLAYQKVKQQQP